MCGIAGILDFSGERVSVEVLRRMTDAMAHRGPDDEGQYADGSVGLGHRRLSIIDLSPAGHQPMTNETGDMVLTYNGEIYNFRELRSELEKAGHVFKSLTDSEVILHAYEEWGEASLLRFNGMFAFAIWDKKRRQLFLARDRYGIKPLYYAQCGRLFLFGSEIKAILAHPAYTPALNKEALLEYFTFQNHFTNRTLFAGVQLFPAGMHMRVASGAAAPEPPVRYWDFHFAEPDRPGDVREYVEELDRLFRQAVTRQLVSDVDVGAYLSGGMDSGSITAIAATHLPCLKTFTCGFDLHSVSGLEMAFDEREQAEHMSYLFKTEHYEMVLKAGDMERIMPRMARHIENPQLGQSYPNFYAAQLAAKFVKVVLSGGGGDELFAGYPWRYYRAVTNVNFEDYVDKYYHYWHRLIPNTVIREVFKPIWPDVAHVWTRDIFRDVFVNPASELTRPEDYVNHSLYFEAKTFLQGVLVVEDKLSMAHGLETRVPFLDNDLVDFALTVPVKLKLRNLEQVRGMSENDLAKYHGPNNDGKVLLRTMMERYVPQEITGARKQGFSAPDASWFKGDSIEYVRRTLLGKDVRLYAYMDRKVVQSLVSDHMEGKQNRRLLIWSLLCFEWWLRTHLDGGVAPR